MKRILTSVLVLLMLFSSFAVSAQEPDNEMREILAEKYSLDEPVKTTRISNWAVDFVKKAKDMGVIEKKAEYEYTAPITREMFCELVYSYMKVIGFAKTSENIHFTDTDSMEVNALYEMEIISGKSADRFSPYDFLTREEAAVILTRMVNKTVDVPVHELYFEFADSDNISDWADNAIQVMCNMGVMTGVGESRFDPKGIYTIEQAIVTIMRVYDAQEASGLISLNKEPVNTVEIVVTKEYSVDDFYINEAVKLSEKAGEAARDDVFISMYVADGEIKESIKKLGNTDYGNPKKIYYLSFNPDKVVEFYKALYEQEGLDEDIDFEKLLLYQRFSLSVFANQINARYGAQVLAAASVLTQREGYIMPEDFKKDFGLFMEYEGDYSVLVTFDKIGEGVIEGRMQHVRRGENADLLAFMSEIYDSLGNECITIGEVR